MKIAWVGIGVMGRSMIQHLLNQGHHLSVYTRSKSKILALLEQPSISWHDSPCAAAEASDVAFSMVGYPSDVKEVILGSSGFLAAKARPRLVVDMTTSTPQLAEDIFSAASRVGVESLDAPVSGGDVGARNATLSIMVGGSEGGFRAVRPLFEALGKTVVHHGGAGKGQHCKMVNQILIASAMTGMCEALAYAKASGLDAGRVIESVGGGAAGSWSVNNLGPRILKGDFAPGFFVEHFCKDLGIALQEARRMDLKLDGLERAEALYRRLQSEGLSKAGTQALWKLYEQDNNFQK